MGRDAGSGGYMSNNQRKKLASELARETKSSSEEESIDDNNDVVVPTATEDDDDNIPIVIDLRKGGTSHNCPNKDAAESHAVTKRCIRAGHVGVCRECNHLVSSKYGCAQHKTRGDELRYTKVKLTGLADDTASKEDEKGHWPWDSPQSTKKKERKAWWKDEGKGLNDATPKEKAKGANESTPKEKSKGSNDETL